MNWDEWAASLEQLIGHGSVDRVVHLLVPRSGESDLSHADAKQLSDLIHSRLFGSLYVSAGDALRQLGYADARRCLPLLYFCAWLARQQEDATAFWPYFYDSVVRGALAKQTVQQSLAHLITSLWWKLHREWGLYRPQEGPVHVKWPQAHAGLVDGEVDLVTGLLVKHAGLPAEPPDVLFDDPSEMLALVRVLLQFAPHVPRRLERLIFGPDPAALVAAELAQNSIRETWPPKWPEGSPERLAHPLAPFLQLDVEPLRLSVVLPDGSVPGYEFLEARFGPSHARLDCTYYARSNQTKFRGFTWDIGEVPWPRDIRLIRDQEEPIELRVQPSPFDAKENGALMFDAGSGRFTRRWWPNREYLLLFASGSNPTWLSKLFVGAEILSVSQLGGVEFKVIGAIARDLILNMARAEAFELLEEGELELERSSAAVSLPDLDDLYKPEVLAWGGRPVTDGRYREYLTTKPPSLSVRNFSQTGIRLAVFRRENDGSDSEIATAEISAGQEHDPLILHLPSLPASPYVVRGTRQPLYFGLSTTSDEVRHLLEITVSLNQPSEFIPGDEMRRFEQAGITITAWPFAPVTMTVTTEAGSRAWLVRCTADGTVRLRSSEIQLRDDLTWAEISCRAWLAKSEPLRLELRPYIPGDEWTVERGKLRARVRGLGTHESGEVIFVSPKPWVSNPQVVEAKIDSDGVLVAPAPHDFDGWVLVGNEAALWLIGEIGDAERQYSIADFLEAVGDSAALPSLCLQDSYNPPGYRTMIALYCLSRVTRDACIPGADIPVPDSLVELVQQYSGAQFLLIPLGGHLLQGRLLANGRRLALDGYTFAVNLLTTGNTVTLVFQTTDRPCICRSCDQVMSSSIWHGHTCKVRSPSSLIAAPQSIVVRVAADWTAVVDTIKFKFLDCFESRSMPEEQLKRIWLDLQEGFKEHHIEAQTPADWITASADNWRLLQGLVSGHTSEPDWAVIWEAMRPYQAGIVAFSSLKPC